VGTLHASQRAFAQHGKRGSLRLRVQRRTLRRNLFAGQSEQRFLCGDWRRTCFGMGMSRRPVCFARQNRFQTPRRIAPTGNWLGKGAKRIRRNGDVPHAARFQIFQMLNRRTEQLAVSIGHLVHRSLWPGIRTKNFCTTFEQEQTEKTKQKNLSLLPLFSPVKSFYFAVGLKMATLCLKLPFA
jgi:hypothetical protein